jgi:hypothetical protein
VNRSPFELESTIWLHRQALRQEADRERLLAATRAQPAWWEPLLARAGRRLIEIGTWLEARYADPIPASSWAAD